MLSSIFVDRPRLAIVIAVVTTIAGLLALSPPQAEVRQADGSWASVEARAVPLGATVRVKPGERFALDGRISAGRSAVDQSPVTGESAHRYTRTARPTPAPLGATKVMFTLPSALVAAAMAAGVAGSAGATCTASGEPGSPEEEALAGESK